MRQSDAVADELDALLYVLRDLSALQDQPSVPARAAAGLAWLHQRYDRRYRECYDLYNALTGAVQTIAPRPVAAAPTSAEAAPAPVSVPPTPAAPATAPRAAVAASLRPTTPRPAQRDRTPLRPRVRGVLAPRLRAARTAMLAELGVDWLAYLGVLLTFTGALGFVLFAYGSVSNLWVRALAPVVMPAVLIVASVRLRRRGSTVVAWTLELLGAALLPIILSATLHTAIDGNFTSHVTSPPAIAARTVMILVLGAVYAVVATRRPSSPLRYLVPAALWGAVWTAGLAFTSTFSAPQVELTAGALLLTIVAMRVRPRLPFVDAARPAAMVTTGVVVVLAALFAVSDGATAILSVALIAIVAVELLAEGTRRTLEVSLLQSLLLVVAVGAAVPSWGGATAGTVAAVAFTALLVWQEIRRPDRYVLLLPLSVAVVGAGLASIDPWYAVVAASPLALAAHLRRLGAWPRTRTSTSRVEAAVTMAVAAALPVALGDALWRALPEGRSLLVIAGVLAGLTVAARVRRPADRFYACWLPIAAALVAGASGLARGSVTDVELGAAVALSAAVIAVACRWSMPRVWASAAALVWASVLLLDGAGVSATVRPGIWAVAALAAVVLASTRRDSSGGQLALAGHTGAGVALGLAAPGGVTLAALSAWTAGWAWTVVTSEVARSPLVSLLDSALRRAGRLRTVAGALPILVLCVSVPFLVVDVLDQVGVTDSYRSGIGIAIGYTAVGYALAVRCLAGRRPLVPIAATAAVVLSAIGIAQAAPDLNASIVAVVESVAVVGVMGGAARRPFMTWFAWLMTVVLALLVADRAGLAPGSLHHVVAGSGAVMLLGSLVYDRIRCGPRRLGEGLRLPWLTPPASIGALVMPCGLAFAIQDTPAVYGWTAIGASAFYLLIALQLRAATVTLSTYALAAFGAAVLMPVTPNDHPLQLVDISAALCVVAFTVSLRWSGRDAWSDWSLPPLVVAHAVAGLALLRAVSVDDVAVTWPACAGLAAALWAWRRHWAWGVGAAGLAVAGASAAGPGWLALALGAVTATTMVAASRQRGVVRHVLQWLSVATGACAWLETLVWAGGASGDEVALTALVSAGVALIIAALVRLRWVGADWAWSWGALSAAGIAVCACLAPTPAISGWTAGGGAAIALVVYAVAASLADRPLGRPWLRWTAAVAAGAAWAELLPVISWGPAPAVATTAELAGVVVLAAALLLRLRPAATAWLLPAMVTGTTAAVASGAGLAQLIANADATATTAAIGVAAGMAMVATAAAVVARRLWWPALTGVAAAALAWSWSAVVVCAGWTLAEAAMATALLSGSVAVVAVAPLRRGRLALPWANALGALAAGGQLAAVLLLVYASPQAPRHPAALIVAAGLGLFAAGTGAAARPLRQPDLRMCAALLAVLAAGFAAYDWQPSASDSVTAAVLVGVATLLLALGLWRRRPGSPWFAPLATTAVLFSAAGLIAALVALPDRAPLIGATLVVAADSLAAGVVLRSRTPLYAAPLLGCTAWFLYATDAFNGDPNWLTSAVGLALLAIVEIARRDGDRARTGSRAAVNAPLLIADGLGMAFLVAATLVEIVAVSPWYGLLGVALGVGLSAWAALTRVRHRLEFGSGVIALSLLLLLVDPVVQLAPALQGIGLWGALALIGMVLLVLAAVIEQSRSRIVGGAQRIGRLMEGWE